MRIFFDFEIRDGFKEREINPMLIAILEEIRNEIIIRLNVFEDIMEKQEERFDSYVVVTILTEKPPMVRFVNYAPSLTKKMVNCFPPEFYTYLNLKLADIFSSWVN